MRNRSLRLIASSIAFFLCSSTSASASSPAGIVALFNDKNVIPLMQEVRSLISALGAELSVTKSARSALELELIQPEEFRMKKDPRWFSRWRDAEENPVTLGLKADIASYRDKMSANTAYIDLLSRLVQLEMRINLSDPSVHEAVPAWIRNRFAALLKDASVRLDPETSSNALAKLEARYSELKADIAALHAPKVDTGLKQRFTNDVVKRSVSEFDNTAEQALGRTLTRGESILLIGLAEKHHRTWSEVLQLFNQLDELGKAGRSDGIDDYYIQFLTRIALENNAAPEQVMKTFLEIDGLGATTQSGFSIHDMEVCVLTQIAFEFRLTPRTVIERFFEFEKLGKTRYKGKNGFDHMDNQAIAQLTHLSFHQPGMTPSHIAERFFAQFDLGATTVDQFDINDLGVAILTEAGVAHAQDIRNVSQRFFQVRSEFLKALGRNEAYDEEYARLADLSFAYAVDPAMLMALVKTVNEIAGTRLPINSIKAILVRAYAIDRMKGLPSVSQETLELVTLTPLENQNLILDYMLDAQTQRSRAATRGRVSNSGRLSDSYSSGTSEGGMGLYFDSEGLKFGIDFGGGTGIDLTDGSLRIGGFDTDGDGFGFKL